MIRSLFIFAGAVLLGSCNTAFDKPDLFATIKNDTDEAICFRAMDLDEERRSGLVQVGSRSYLLSSANDIRSDAMQRSLSQKAIQSFVFVFPNEVTGIVINAEGLLDGETNEDVFTLIAYSSCGAIASGAPLPPRLEILEASFLDSDQRERWLAGQNDVATGVLQVRLGSDLAAPPVTSVTN
jgi:hypothetical protein